MAKKAPASSPMGILFGWLPTDSAKDARAYAKNIILQRFVAHDESWYGILKFQNGYLWEAHHGGVGKGFLKAAAKALNDDPGGKHWFQAGEKVYRIEMQDGKPFPHLHPLDKSVEVLNSGETPIEATSQLMAFKSKGTGVLVSGCVAAGLAAIYFVGAISFYAIAYNPGPSVRNVDPTVMPHAQWSRVKPTKLEEIVSKLEFENKTWKVDVRKHTIEGLEKLRQLRAALEQLNRDAERQLEARRVQIESEAQIRDEEDTKRRVAAAKETAKPIAAPNADSTKVQVPQAVRQRVVPAATNQVPGAVK
jgi:hypothetical protein